jgi:hypothetical protein
VSKVRTEIKGVRGGNKQLWLKLNRGKVLDYYHENGLKATLVEFNLRASTFERFLDRKELNLDKLTKVDRALYISKTSIEMSREASRRVSEVEGKVEAMKPVIQVVYALGQAMRMAASLSGSTDLLKSGKK